ncbi:hypothetical protein PENTCL1PPCAC_735, partial [Pristionchus entomophagus]
PASLILFSEPISAFLLATYPIGQAIVWTFLSIANELDVSHVAQDHYFAEFNQTITGWRRNDEFNLRAFLVLFVGVFLMCINFNIAIFLASQTILQIRKAKTFSSNFRSIQIKILQALFAQTFVPVLFVYVPFGYAITIPFLKIDDVYRLGYYCTTVTSFFPV